MSTQLKHEAGPSIEGIIESLRAARDEASGEEYEFLRYLIEMALHEAIGSSSDFRNEQKNTAGV